MHRVAIVLTAFWMLAGQAAGAQMAVSGPQDTPARGVGAQTCVGILQTLNADPKKANLSVASWVQGYFSGRNMQLLLDGQRMRDLEPVLGQMVQIYDLCATRPPQTQFIEVIDIYFQTLPELPGTIK